MQEILIDCCTALLLQALQAACAERPAATAPQEHGSHAAADASSVTFTAAIEG